MDILRERLAFIHDDVIESVSRSFPLRSSPLLVRPVLVFILAGWLVLLGILGMARIPEIPINDKVLHFFGMGIATFLLYFIIEVPDQARRIWYYRRAPLILTLFCGFFCGGILSEVVQGWLPWKTFDWMDIFANLLGCTLFFLLGHYLLQRSRKRYVISRLYQPLHNASPLLHSESRPSNSNNFHTRARDRFVDLERARGAGVEGEDEDEDVEDVWGDRERDRVRQRERERQGERRREEEAGNGGGAFTIGDDDERPGNTT